MILPSSVHELLAIPDDGHMSYDELRAMVRDVNRTQLAPQEFLSDNILKYDGNKLTVHRDDLKMEIPKVEMPKLEREVRYGGMKM